jgi:uncharacterized protein
VLKLRRSKIKSFYDLGVFLQLEGNNVIHATPETIFAAMQDPAVLAKCVPGVKSLEPDGEGVFKGALEVSLGPVKGVFNGKVSIVEKLPPQALTLKVEMRAPIGVASAVGRITLYPEPDGTTRVHWMGEPKLGGMIASVGARLLGGVAKAQADLFFASLEQELSGA